MLRRNLPLLRKHAIKRVLVHRRATGLSVATVAICLARAGGRCEGCGVPHGSRRGVDFSLHHRLPRRMGGTSVEAVNSASNVVVLGGSGTTGCHGWVESHRADAYARGLLLHAGEVPSATSVDLVYGLVFLDDVGGWELVPS